MSPFSAAELVWISLDRERNCAIILSNYDIPLHFSISWNFSMELHVENSHPHRSHYYISTLKIRDMVIFFQKCFKFFPFSQGNLLKGYWQQKRLKVGIYKVAPFVYIIKHTLYNITIRSKISCFMHIFFPKTKNKFLNGNHRDNKRTTGTIWWMQNADGILIS